MSDVKTLDSIRVKQCGYSMQNGPKSIHILLLYSQNWLFRFENGSMKQKAQDREELKTVTGSYGEHRYDSIRLQSAPLVHTCTTKKVSKKVKF